MRALTHSSARAFNFPLSAQHGAILHQLLREQHSPQTLQAAAQGPVCQKRREISTARFKPPARANTKASSSFPLLVAEQSSHRGTKEVHEGARHSATPRSQRCTASSVLPRWLLSLYPHPPGTGLPASNHLDFDMPAGVFGENADKPSCQQLPGLWLLEAAF